MRIETIIIDDHKDDLLRILQALSRISAESSEVQFVSYPFQHAAEMNMFDKEWYIIDIDLGEDNTTGFDMAERIKEKNNDAKIIFCTSHNDLVFQSFDTDVFYFIRKSHLEQDLLSAMKKYVRLLTDRQSSYIIRQKNNILPIQWKSIVYFEVSGNDLYIHTDDNKEYRERKALKQLIDEIPENTFLQPARYLLVNCRFVRSIDKDRLVMDGGQFLPIVRERISITKNDYLKYLARRG